MKNCSHRVDTEFLKRLFELEKRGEYQESITQIRQFWTDFDQIPNGLDLEQILFAELILRCGATIGFLGSANQIANAQEQSKNLLTIARESYLALFNFEKVAECENYLALAYWRNSSYSEAEFWVENAFLHNLSNTNYTRLYSYIVKSLILFSQQNFEQIIDILKPLEKDFIKNKDVYLMGSFASNIAIAYKNSSQFEKAFYYLSVAKLCHEKGKNLPYLATVENILAQTYRIKTQFAEAHKSVDNALSILAQTTNDRRWLGVFTDTKALIYLDEQKYAEALETVEKALSYLRGDDYNFLVDITKTKLKILIALQKFEEAYLQFGECYKILTTYSDESIVRSFANDFHKMVSGSNHIKIYKESAIDKEEEIEFIFPKDYQSQFSQNSFVIQIHNLNLINFGIRPGMIAIAETDCEIKNGDLVAACITENSESVVGVYSADFGIVCIERYNNIPMIFNEIEIEKIGKIIGYGLPEKNFSNRETVKIKTIA
jgi:tetratricopeptide (TPR) repeat protein